MEPTDDDQYYLDRIAVLEEESRDFQMKCRSLRLASLHLERLLESAGMALKGFVMMIRGENVFSRRRRYK